MLVKPINSTVQEIMPGVLSVNLTKQEITKLKVYLREDIQHTLFSAIPEIYKTVHSNFHKCHQILVLPYNENGTEKLIIQRVKA